MRIMIVDPGFSYSTLAVAESYTRAFEKCGYEVMEYNLLDALKEAQLAKKNGNLLDITEFACAPILRHVINDGIDFVFVVHGYYMNPEILLSLKRLGCKLGLILTDDPMQIDMSKKWSIFYDFVFSNEKNTIKHHNNCFYLPMAVDEDLFEAGHVHYSYLSQILFAGSMYKERVDFIDESQQLQNLMLYYKTTIVGSSKLRFKNEKINELVVANKISYEEMAKYTRGSVCLIDYPKNEFRDGIFGDSNTSGIIASCLSPRIFEAALARSIPITTRAREEINVLFPEELIPQYSNEIELCNIIEEIQNGDYEKVSYEIYKYCKENHTYTHRVRSIEKMIDLKPSKKILIGSLMNEKTTEKWEEDWKSNFAQCKMAGYYNNSCGIDFIKDWYKGCESKALIISNGPSLENYLESLKYQKGVKFCVNNSLRYVGNSQFVVVIHPNKEVYERCFKDISKYSIKKSTLIASTVADFETIKLWQEKGSGAYFFSPSNEDGIKKLAYETTNFPLIPVCSTVGYSAIQIAMYLGLKEICIYGLDLCYLDMKKYAFEKLNLKNCSRDMTYTENMLGEAVLTDKVMLKTKEGILELIKRNPDIMFRVYGRGILYCESLSNLKNEV